MTKVTKKLGMVAAGALLALGTGNNLLAQGAPINGTGVVTYTVVDSTGNAVTSVIPPNTDFYIDVGINLTGVMGQGCSAQVNAILGAYQIAMEFDRTRIEYLDADSSDPNPTFCGANRPGQYAFPTATDPGAANTSGTALFVAQNGGSQTAPVGGPRCYFRIHFRTRNNVGTQQTMFRFRDNALGANNLASAVLACGGTNQGPVSIPFNNDVTVTVTTTPVNLQSFQAE
jgi:hypothetical protein